MSKSYYSLEFFRFQKNIAQINGAENRYSGSEINHIVILSVSFHRITESCQCKHTGKKQYAENKTPDQHCHIKKLLSHVFSVSGKEYEIRPYPPDVSFPRLFPENVQIKVHRTR